ncbi:hypothetical protein BOTCAL_0247g00050 [Botryotinia calthae]|uniref:ribonuclease H n=1 Tax=Botryotinia calthae TaxID=38488 RepID=A0A4Y8CWR5_9HELO|nr:hypothetical protein BOTCAL_0247g00050 [Botryotinia calthae]
MASGWIPDMNPIELPGGILVCRAHCQIICFICCCDYSFMQDLQEQGENSDSASLPDARSDDEDSETFEHPEYQVFDPQEAFTVFNKPGTNGFNDALESELDSDPIPTITKFRPPLPSDTPSMLFRPAHRFIRRTNPNEILLYTDGSCLSNGLASPRAGCGFVISPHHKINFRLENTGPTGELHRQTSNRAELRAVVAALEYRAWQSDSVGAWSRVVIATDSEYVVLGATERINGWVQRGWRTSTGTDVKNLDLWKRLVYCIKKVNRPMDMLENGRGAAVAFWRIPRQWNEQADAEAKRGADLEEEQEFRVPTGVMV